MNNKLFVGNLSFQTTENDLNDAFAAHGTVTEANLVMDRATNRSRGFAFVTMSTDEEAQKAIAAMNGADLNGRAITVNVARPREERGGGGGGVVGVVMVEAVAVGAVMAVATAIVANRPKGAREKAEGKVCACLSFRPLNWREP